MRQVLKVSDLIQKEEKKESKPIQLIKCLQHPSGKWEEFTNYSNNRYTHIINLGLNHCGILNIFACYEKTIDQTPNIWLGHLNDGTY